MINDEINRKVIQILINSNKEAIKLILKYMIMIANNTESLVTKKNEKPLGELIKKGQLENIDIEKGEFKELKKVLNKYGVNFSVMKDKENNNYSVFFESKNTAVMEKAFKKAVRKFEKKEERKESTIKKIKEFKEKSKAIFNDKDKIKNKQKEQSL